MKNIITIDLDYFGCLDSYNNSDLKELDNFIRIIKTNNIKYDLIREHHKILEILENESDYKLINFDFHSDVGDNIDDINEGNWVTKLGDIDYTWVTSNYHESYVLKRGLCYKENDELLSFDETCSNLNIKNYKFIHNSTIDDNLIKNAHKLIICLSPEWTRSNVLNKFVSQLEPNMNDKFDLFLYRNKFMNENLKLFGLDEIILDERLDDKIYASIQIHDGNSWNVIDVINFPKQEGYQKGYLYMSMIKLSSDKSFRDDLLLSIKNNNNIIIACKDIDNNTIYEILTNNSRNENSLYYEDMIMKIIHNRLLT